MRCAPNLGFAGDFGCEARGFRVDMAGENATEESEPRQGSEDRSAVDPDSAGELRGCA